MRCGCDWKGRASSSLLSNPDHLPSFDWGDLAGGCGHVPFCSYREVRRAGLSLAAPISPTRSRQSTGRQTGALGGDELAETSASHHRRPACAICRGVLMKGRIGRFWARFSSTRESYRQIAAERAKLLFLVRTGPRRLSVLSRGRVTRTWTGTVISSMDKTTRFSLFKRAVICVVLVVLYGLFGTLLHAGGGARDAVGSIPALTKGQ